MKYVKLTLEYLKGRHFRTLAWIALLPAIGLALLKSFSTTASYFINFSSENSGSFAEIFRLSTRFGWQSVLKGAASVLIISLVTSYILGVITRHMRTGKMDLSRCFSKINDNFLPTLCFVTIAAIFIVLFGLLDSTFIFLWSKVAGKSTPLVVILSLLTMAGLFFVLIALLTYSSLWVPAMTLTGQPVLSSLSSSIRETKDHGFFSFFAAVLLPLIPAFGIEYLTSLADLRILTVLGDFVFYFLLLTYYPVFSVASYYDALGLDREDLLRANRM